MVVGGREQARQTLAVEQHHVSETVFPAKQSVDVGHFLVEPAAKRAYHDDFMVRHIRSQQILQDSQRLVQVVGVLVGIAYDITASRTTYIRNYYF